MLQATTRTRPFLIEFERSFESGDFGQLAPFYATDALLEDWTRLACRTALGPKAIAAHLQQACPPGASVVCWQAEETPQRYQVDVRRITSGTPTDGGGERHLIFQRRGVVYSHLIYPAALGQPDLAERERVADVLSDLHCLEPVAGGTSGALIYRAAAPNGSRVIVKLVSRQRDWIARATQDRGREVLLWQSGYFEALPACVRTAIIQVREEQDGWIIVMRDEQRALRAFERRSAQNPRVQLMDVVQAVRQLHRLPLPSDATILCTCADRLRLFSPLRPYLERNHRDTIPKTLTRMWQAFAEQPEREIVDAVLHCVSDPTMLLKRINDKPKGLLHGDLRRPNLGWEDGRLVLLDWALAYAGPMELELVSLACDASFWCDVEPEDLLDTWCRHCAGSLDAEALELAFVFLAAMGELAYLVHEVRHCHAASHGLAAERARWWIRRVGLALERAAL